MAVKRKSQVGHEGLLGEEDVLIVAFLPQEQTAETYSCMLSIRRVSIDCKYCDLMEAYVSKISF